MTAPDEIVYIELDASPRSAMLQTLSLWVLWYHDTYDDGEESLGGYGGPLEEGASSFPPANGLRD